MPDPNTTDLLLDYILEDADDMNKEELRIHAGLRAHVAALRTDADNWRWVQKQASGPLALLIKAAETRNTNKSGKDNDHE